MHSPDRRRFMNRNGTFNTLRVRSSADMFSYLGVLTMSWRRFFVLAALLHVGSNIVFGFAYYLCGPAGLMQNGAMLAVNRLWMCFFFSMETLSTIGYGGLVPTSLMANLIVAVESVYGVLAIALITGLFFARIARMRPRLRFSDRATLYATDDGARVLELRLSNRSRSEVLDLNARIIFSSVECTIDDAGGKTARRFLPLTLERPTTAFLPLAWKVRHRIDSNSPLFSLDEDALRAISAEFLVLVMARDESSGQAVTARTSYITDEIAFNRRHGDTYIRDETRGVRGIDFDRFDSLV